MKWQNWDTLGQIHKLIQKPIKRRWGKKIKRNITITFCILVMERIMVP